jgi:hypothetical protein
VTTPKEQLLPSIRFSSPPISPDLLEDGQDVDLKRCVA